MELNFVDCEVNIFEVEVASGIDAAEKSCDCADSFIVINHPADVVWTDDLAQDVVSLTDNFAERLHEIYEAHGWVAPSDECECEEFCDCRGAEGTE